MVSIIGLIYSCAGNVIPLLLGAGGVKMPLLLTLHLCRNVFEANPQLLRAYSDHLANFCVFNTFAALAPSPAQLKKQNPSAFLPARVLLNAFLASYADGNRNLDASPTTIASDVTPMRIAGIDPQPSRSPASIGSMPQHGPSPTDAAFSQEDGEFLPRFVRKLLELAECSPLLCGREPSQSGPINQCKVQLWQTLCLLAQSLTADSLHAGQNPCQNRTAADSSVAGQASSSAASACKRKHSEDGAASLPHPSNFQSTEDHRAGVASEGSGPSEIASAAWRCLLQAKQHANVRRLMQLFAVAVISKVGSARALSLLAAHMPWSTLFMPNGLLFLAFLFVPSGAVVSMLLLT